MRLTVFILFFLNTLIAFGQAEETIEIKEKYSINKLIQSEDECSLYLKGIEITPTYSTATFYVANLKNINKSFSIQAIFSDDYSEIEIFGIELAKKITVKANSKEEFSIKYSNSAVIIFLEGINMGGKANTNKIIRLKSSGELEKHFSRNKGVLAVDLSKILKRSVLLKKY